MGVQTDPIVLRPLSIGEIFDRAVTLVVRNWAPFTIIGAVAVLPARIAEYLAGAVNPLWMLAYYVLSALLVVATLASARVVAQLYRGEAPDWRAGLSCGFSRFFGAIGANFTIGLVALLPLLIIIGVPAGLGVFRFSNVATDAIAIAVIVCVGAIFIATQFSCVYALNAMAIDGYRAMDAVGRAFALFDRSTVARTLLVGLAQTAIVIGGSFVAGAMYGLLGAGMHQAALGRAIETIIVFVATVYGNAITPVFYFDVAIRSEGYDMQAALDAMPN